jgi:hypothetical protein
MPMRLTLLLLLSTLLCSTLFANDPPRHTAEPPDEGMWLPLLISQNFDEMRARGIQLRPEQIYSVNNGSLKDAIVHFGGFCTGEIISDQGLILTNHHCGYDAIQSLSTIENNHLENGFWAKSKTEELPVSGLFVRFLVRMEDVSARINGEIANLSGIERDRKITELSQKIVAENTANSGYTAEVKSMYYGAEFYLFVYESYNDVRLVGTPTESIGKFGGDTDNWMWPRHTGDFSLFRVYAGPNGKPASYSPSNIPLKPKHFLPIAGKGIKPNDYTMIMGYPGRTERYLTSDIVQMRIEQSNPARVKLRTLRLKVWKEAMDVDPKVRLQYSSKYARISNYWKYFIGQTRGLKRLKTVELKKQEEAEFLKWANANPTLAAKYGSVVSNVGQAVQEFRNYNTTFTYFNECATAPEIVDLAQDFIEMQGGNASAVAEKLKPAAEKHFKDYNRALDQRMFAEMYQLYAKDVPQEQQPLFFRNAIAKYKGNTTKWAADVFKKSMFGDANKLMAFLNNPNLKALEKDPAYQLALQFNVHHQTVIMPQYYAYQAKIDQNLRTYIAGMREKNRGTKFYPDANSTMRVTYGQVLPYKPADGVDYGYITTGKGIVEKEDPTDPEFVVPTKLIDLIKRKDFGRWAENGELPVCFICNTDITGGNSGSPVINGKGELCGLAFDGNWEAMSGDIDFDADYKRTINVDIRYVLFIVDKFAGANNIIQELKIVD